ncbi:MAG: hypothetical protein OEW05_03205 [Candidatus Aminicenantes bacterium]|nr:hypothetical protein [Candidatus Aminicenantes bacterium]
MKKKWVVGLTLVSMLAIFTVNAYPWGSAVHVYVAFKLKGFDPNVMYGAMAPDCFNYYFDPPYEARPTLYGQFHNNPIALWDAAAGDPVKQALAYGFLSHGHVGGADTTAHLAGAHFGKKDGYVIDKAKILDNILTKFPEYRMLKAKYPEVSLEVAHNLVENAIDILIKRVDPQIGQKIQLAAILRDPIFPDWLASVYVYPFSYLIPVVEDAFCGMMIGYGWLFDSYSEPDLVYWLSQQMAGFAGSFLPPDAQIPYETAFAIAKYGTEKAMTICQGTFSKEIEATVKYVESNLAGYIY